VSVRSVRRQPGDVQHRVLTASDQGHRTCCFFYTNPRNGRLESLIASGNRLSSKTACSGCKESDTVCYKRCCIRASVHTDSLMQRFVNLRGCCYGQVHVYVYGPVSNILLQYLSVFHYRYSSVFPLRSYVYTAFG